MAAPCAATSLPTFAERAKTLLDAVSTLSRTAPDVFTNAPSADLREDIIIINKYFYFKNSATLSLMKIIFCMPGRSYSREFLLAWSDLLMQASSKGHQIMISQQYSSVVHFARAKCLGGDVLKGPDQKPFQGQVEYDAMMWIDSDIVFKPEDFFRILESPHDVTAGHYMMEDLQHMAVVKEWDEDHFKKNGSFEFMKPDDLAEAPEYMPVAYAGMGWMMIRKGVVEKLKYPWFRSELNTMWDGDKMLVDICSEDVSFCNALKAAGHPVHLDTKLRVGHQKMLII
jgi:hypothetical protein